ncbi:MAG TPA: hypothetical protein VIL30_25380 [Ramlibacter sp.]|jgi:hypothetical protein
MIEIQNTYAQIKRHAVEKNVSDLLFMHGREPGRKRDVLYKPGVISLEMYRSREAHRHERRQLAATGRCLPAYLSIGLSNIKQLQGVDTISAGSQADWDVACFEVILFVAEPDQVQLLETTLHMMLTEDPRVTIYEIGPVPKGGIQRLINKMYGNPLPGGQPERLFQV